jgi:cyclopropane fatty-acyl-phospholipid synthase-like methyltransferase
MSQFTKDYYENGKASHLSCYENYRWLPNLTIPMAESLVAACAIKRNDTILDFGCAKGYLVKALRGLGYSAYGIDISEYALSHADEETKPFLVSGADGLDMRFDWIICKDVLEHIEECELSRYLKLFRRLAPNLLTIVPLGNNGTYTIPDMEMDVTHRIRRPLWWWSSQLDEAGFKAISSSFSMKGVKENWTAKYPFGNGFLITH